MKKLKKQLRKPEHKIVDYKKVVSYNREGGKNNC